MKKLAILMILLLSFGLRAEELQEYWSNEGDIYFATIGKDAAVLRSKYPKSWFHGGPYDDHLVHTKRAIIYLGADCRAYHNEYGVGTWLGGNGAFGATFRRHNIYFNRQELFGTQFSKCYSP